MDGTVRWELVTRTPAPAGAGGVLRIGDYHEGGIGGMTRVEVPRPPVAIIVSLEGPVLVADRDREHGPPLQARAFVAALDERHAIAHTPRGWRGVQIDLTPPAAHALLRWPMNELSGEVIELEDVLGARVAGRLLAALRGGNKPRERLDAAESFVPERLADGPIVPADVEWSWRRLIETGGRARVDELAVALGCSPRHLGRRFAAYVGLPPKRAARITRFARTMELLERRPLSPLARLAAECGYADQAHMSREVSAFAGRPAAALARRMLPAGGIAA